ncbi:SRPBCC family protein [Phenylobacterium sp. LjRoot164]|uniref:SRPBCC family protein n=1 Tax=unclassified Phenylobacterium TaxID=2640670 RepID=UPI003ED08DFE
MTSQTEHIRSDAPLTAHVDQSELAKETAEALGWDHAAVVGRSITVNLPREQVYAFWRDFQNFPSFMENIEAVRIEDDRRSHWVVQAPGGDTVEWDALLNEDVPGELIAWSSVEDAEVKNAGRVEFRDAPPGRGTVVTATIAYEAPAGRLGQMIAKLFQEEPKIQARRDLRRLKQFLETGEVATSRNRRDEEATS